MRRRRPRFTRSYGKLSRVGTHAQAPSYTRALVWISDVVITFLLTLLGTTVMALVGPGLAASAWSSIVLLIALVLALILRGRTGLITSGARQAPRAVQAILGQVLA